MRMLLFGSTGMAGSSIKIELLRRNFEVVGASRSGADLTCNIEDESQIAQAMYSDRYDAVINAAAQIDIDKCEQDPLKSWRVNAKAVSIITNFCKQLKLPFMHISTDHFYNYGSNQPHKETDPIFCVNEYARHKLAAECYALNYAGSLVLRTSILGRATKGRTNLIDWAIDSLVRQQPIELFCDAWTSSLDVHTFSKYAVELFLERSHRGLLNLASSEVYSKEKLVRTLASMLEIDHSNCVTGSIKAVPNRANCLGLDASAAQKILGRKLPCMEKVCRNVIKDMFFNH